MKSVELGHMPVSGNGRAGMGNEDVKNVVLVLVGIVAFTAVIHVSRSYGYGYSYSAGSFSLGGGFVGVFNPNNQTSADVSFTKSGSSAKYPGPNESLVGSENRSPNGGPDGFSGSKNQSSPVTSDGGSSMKQNQQSNFARTPPPAPAEATSGKPKEQGDEGGHNITVNRPEISLAPAPFHNDHGSSFPVSLPNKTESWISVLNQQLLSAKQEIEKSPTVYDDADLYGPLYHNLSRFKRSYELMEKIFKVFIYPDGERPYFHSGPMASIYASEGWFMKQMQESTQFVTKNYRKAHAFYMPYSVVELRQGIPAPEHHNQQQIADFIRNYINLISNKYPFWNRTHGRDHFFVACHDWGGYTTAEHKELKTNAIKIICNSDTSDGYFRAEHDDSLPETNLDSMKQPPDDLGGLPPKERPIFAFFAGQRHGRVRPVLFKYWKGKDPEMLVYESLPKSIARKKSYKQHMKESKYCICPMGYEVNSPRMVEAIYYDCVPVIIADNFFLPFREVIDWDSFSFIVAEKDIPNLKSILKNISESVYLTKQSRISKVRKHFLWHRDSPKRYDIFHMILHSVWSSRLKAI